MPTREEMIDAGWDAKELDDLLYKEGRMTDPEPDQGDYHDMDGNPISLCHLCEQEPKWAENRIRTLLCELQKLMDAHQELAQKRDLLSCEGSLLKQQADTNADFIRQYQAEVTKYREALKKIEVLVYVRSDSPFTEHMEIASDALA